MTRTEKRSLTVTISGAAFICVGFVLVATGETGAGTIVSFVGSIVLAVGVTWLAVHSRRNRT